MNYVTLPFLGLAQAISSMSVPASRADAAPRAKTPRKGR